MTRISQQAFSISGNDPAEFLRSSTTVIRVATLIRRSRGWTGSYHMLPSFAFRHERYRKSDSNEELEGWEQRSWTWWLSVEVSGFLVDMVGWTAQSWDSLVLFFCVPVIGGSTVGKGKSPKRLSLYWPLYSHWMYIQNRPWAVSMPSNDIWSAFAFRHERYIKNDSRSRIRKPASVFMDVMTLVGGTRLLCWHTEMDKPALRSIVVSDSHSTPSVLHTWQW